jgi:hypothetical protein
MSNEYQSEKQIGVYIVGTILAALIGFGVWQSPNYGAGLAWIAFGTTIFGVLVCNYFLFHEDLERELAVGYGVFSLITAFYGTYVTYQVIPAAVYGIVIVCAILGIYLTPEKSQQQVRSILY